MGAENPDVLETVVMMKYRASHLTPVRRDHLIALREHEVSEIYGEREAIRDILEGRVRKAFDTSKTYFTFTHSTERGHFPEYVAYRTQTGTAEDLFGKDSTLCCTLLPGGSQQAAAALQVVDPHMALIRAVPGDKNGEGEPIGVAYTFLAETPGASRYLVVDSVEGNQKKLPSGWQEHFYNVFLDFAQEQQCSGIHINTRVHNKTAKAFVKYVQERELTGLKNLILGVVGGTETIQQYGMSLHYLESYGEWKDKEKQVMRPGWVPLEGEIIGITIPIKRSRVVIPSQEALPKIPRRGLFEFLFGVKLFS